MKKFIFLYIIISLFLFKSQFAHAVAPDAAAEQTKATREKIGPILAHRTEFEVLELIDKTREVFQVPISFEWSYIDESRRDLKMPKIPFTISPGDSLADVLDRFCSATGKQFQWGRIRGIICVWPTGTNGTTESMLDVRVTVNVEGASAWEAILQLVREVNAKAIGAADRYMVARPTFTKEIYTPPLVFRNEHVISLSLQDVSAREAICAIMAASPIRMSFWYFNSYHGNIVDDPRSSSQLTLWFYNENGSLAHGPRVTDVREYGVWRAEALATVPTLSPNPSRQNP